MKQAVIAALLTLCVLLLLSHQQEAPPLSTATPPPMQDKSVVFTVATDKGIETTDMASYLPGVLAGEMPALFEEQALMAQAVAARTYILHRMGRTVAAHPTADICNSPACCKAYAAQSRLKENWGEHYDAYWDKISRAVTSTDGEYLTYEGSPIEAVFHSSSSGATEASGNLWNDRAYLISVESPETAADVPDFVTEVTFSPAALQEALTAAYPQLQLPSAPSQWLSSITYTDSGRADQVTLGNLTLSGAQLRSVLQLRSTCFTVDYTDDGFLFTVEGYGHGVGMSQYGANVYAKQGWDYKAILSHYYPSTQLASTAG